MIEKLSGFYYLSGSMPQLLIAETVSRKQLKKLRMSIKHKELEIAPNKPFEFCKLERRKYALVLTRLCETYQDGFVLALNNKWGTGKSTFLKMWNQHLLDNEFVTVYFNAWENDFEDSPLTALMGELKELKTVETETQFKSVLGSAAKISKHLVPTVVKAIAEKYISVDSINQALADVSQGVADIFEDDVNKYAQRKRSIAEFKQKLSAFVQKTSNDKPIIFIVDELDRCRPNYAVSVLEQIKHFFSVPNIVFVLSIDKDQLGNSVRGVYGSDRIDADEYLKRFIDVEYSLPVPEPGVFARYLYDYFAFDEFFESADRRKFSELAYDKESFLNICNILFDGDITLRQQEKVFALSRIGLRSFASNNYVMPSLYLFLVYLKEMKPQIYYQLNQKQLSLNELQNAFYNIVEKKVNDDTRRILIRVEAYLINSYNNFINYPYLRDKLIEYKDGKNVLLVQSKIDTTKENSDFLHAIESLNHGARYGDVSIEHLLKKINLTELFKVA